MADNTRMPPMRPNFLSLSWIARHLFVILVVSTCTMLGLWQLARMRQRAAFNTLLETRLDAPATPWQELRAQYQAEAPIDQPKAAAYRRATIRGYYDTDYELLLTPRARDGQPGFDLITPLVFAEGRAILVDRGWIPLALNQPPIVPAAPPAGEVRIEGFVLPEQDPPEARLSPRNPPEGALVQSFYVDVDRLQAQIPYQLERAYLLLAEQDPPQPSTRADAPGFSLPQLPLRPEPEAGPHLSYAVQWFSFATIGLVGYALLLRARWRGGQGDD